MRKGLFVFLLLLSTASAQWYVREPMLGVEVDHGHPMAAGLKGCWLLNETNGESARDLSGFGNDGTLQADAYYTPRLHGSVVDLDGTDDCVAIASRSYYTPTALTVIVRAQVDDWQDDQVLTGVYDNNGDNRSWIFGPSVSGDNRLGFLYSSAGTDYDERRLNYNDTGWHTFAATYDGGTGVAIYIDGVSQSLLQGIKSGSPSSGLYDADEVMYIGRVVAQGGTANDIDAKIDYMFIWDRELTAEEIKAHYDNPFAMFPEESMAAIYKSGIAAPPAGGAPQVIIIMSMVPAWVILILVVSFALCNKGTNVDVR